MILMIFSITLCPDSLSLSSYVDPPEVVFWLFALADLALIILAVSTIIGIATRRHRVRIFAVGGVVASITMTLGWLVTATLFWGVEEFDCGVSRGTSTSPGLFVWRDESPDVYLALAGAMTMLLGLWLHKRWISSGFVLTGGLAAVVGNWIPVNLFDIQFTDFGMPGLSRGLAIFAAAIAYALYLFTKTGRSTTIKENPP